MGDGISWYEQELLIDEQDKYTSVRFKVVQGSFQSMIQDDNCNMT